LRSHFQNSLAYGVCESGPAVLSLVLFIFFQFAFFGHFFVNKMFLPVISSRQNANGPFFEASEVGRFGRSQDGFGKET